MKDSGIVDEDTANIVESVADGVKDQAEADHNTSLKDRAKMAGECHNMYTDITCTYSSIILVSLIKVLCNGLFINFLVN